MPRGKQYVFSARTTEEGLRILNTKKAELGISWDDLVIDAVNTHYGVDVPKPPKVEKMAKVKGKDKKTKIEG